MLSIENPPPDPSCPYDISQLKASSDERASHKLALPEVDLSEPPLFGDNPLPKFSIRDYVFSARTKDIKTNWPFSVKNLQLCLKHGVKDVLPPFQPLDKVRNRSFERCMVESSTPEEKNDLSNFDGQPSGPDDHAELLDLSHNAQLNQKQAEACTDITSCRSEGENDFPSTTTSVSQSEIESLATNRPSSSPVDTTDTLPEPEASVEVEAAVLPPLHKTESTSRPASKKCRLVVKFGSNSDRSSTEDLASNCTTVSELTMASKICPVCKTFSSSSNTTLNAHIDQCLSVESTPKWMADSKLTRHRIKPRKTRLMVDIYVTAKSCTLEELDKRNGTSWAIVSNLPTRDSEKPEMPAEVKKQKMLQVHPEDAGDVGAVYIDANGTKLRILSKFNDAAPSVSKVREDLGPRKPLKGGKVSKFLAIKKKKRRASKHYNYLKFAPQSKKLFSHKNHSSQICLDQEGYDGVEERCEKKEHQIEKQVKPHDSGNLRQWVCSKRTGITKKVNRKDGHQTLKSKWHVSRDLLVESDQLCSGDSLMERSQVSKLTNVSRNPISSPENSERIENSFCETQVSDKMEQSPGRKRFRTPWLGAGKGDNVERPLPPMKRNANQLDKDSNSICDGCMLKTPKSTGNRLSLLSNKTDDIAAGPSYNSDIPPGASANPSRSCHSLTSRAMKVSSSRKTVSSVRSRSSVTECRPDVVTNCSALMTSQMHLMDEVVPWYSEADQQYDLMHNRTENQSGREDISNELYLGRSDFQESRQNKGAISIAGREEAMVLKSSQLASQCYGHDEDECRDSSVRVGDDFLDKVDGSESARKEIWIHGEDTVIEEASPRTVTRLCKSVDSEFHKLGSCTKTPPNSVRSIEDYKGPICGAEAPIGPTESSFVDGYCADEVGNSLIGQNVHTGEEMDSEIGQANFFPEVDPIPIPGPPGSFLPSPGGMGSEDLQGNSSLTTSLVQSSQDQHDFIDGDSSDSPVSATSTISNSMVVGYDQKFSESLLSVGPQSVQDKLRSGFSGASIEPSAESAAAVPQKMSTGVERFTFDGENCKVNKISIERPLSFKSDEPCCCQRKERTFQGVALNYQDSPLLKRRAVASVTMPTMGKQMGCSLNIRPNNLDVRPEIFSLSSCSSSRSEKVVAPSMKSPAGPIPLKGSPDAGAKFPSRGGCDSVSPSSTNPVLRLMGKNLMVVNKDEDASVQPGQPQPHPQINHLTSQFPTFSGVSPGNTQNQVYHNSFHHMVPQIGQDPHNAVGQCFDGRLSNSFRSNTTSKTPQTVARGLSGLFPDQRKDGGFIASMEPHEYKGNYNVPIQQNRGINRPIGVSTCSVERFRTIHDCQQTSGHSAANANKEIIVIDDPDSDEVGKYCGGLGESQQVVSSGISIPMVPNYNSRHVNPLSYYQSQDPSHLGELPMAHNASFHATPSRGANASPVRWSCTSEGSGVLQRSPFFAPSASTGHLRSALYNSPSLS